ncbi:MAG TPA: BON domain-containing protein [Myxococcus sp.]|nr:BON domain-containing protein [Myxococcus sp.]
MNGRRDDDRRRGYGDPEEYPAGRRGGEDRDWDEHGYERGPELRGWDGRDERGADENFRKNGRELTHSGRSDWDEDQDFEHPARDFERDRDFLTAARDRETRDFETDRDFGRAARDLDRAREYGGDFNRDREMDRRGRERSSRHEESPSGAYRAFQEEIRDERERPRRYGDRSRPTSLPVDTDRWGSGQYAMGAGGRYGGDMGRSGEERGGYGFATRGFGQMGDQDRRAGSTRDFNYSERNLRGGGRPLERGDNRGDRGRRGGGGRIAEEDTRFGGREPGGHGPGVENMAPPRVGYSTSPSRRDDHEMGHGQFLGGAYRSATPSRVQRPSSPTGRGPKGYQRGDDRIRADICDRLMQGWMNAEDVEVQVKDGEVTLSGTVRGRDEKRAIEDLAEEVLGVKDVTNNIRINRAEGAQHRPSRDEPVVQPRGDMGDDRNLHS